MFKRILFISTANLILTFSLLGALSAGMGHGDIDGEEVSLLDRIDPHISLEVLLFTSPFWILGLILLVHNARSLMIENGTERGKARVWHIFGQLLAVVLMTIVMLWLAGAAAEKVFM